MREKNPRVSLPLNEAVHKPNNLQMAIAQTAIGLLKKYPHQIHVIGGGQGKSRIAAVIALLALEIC